MVFKKKLMASDGFQNILRKKMTQRVLSVAVVVGAIRVIQYGIQSKRKLSIE